MIQTDSLQTILH